MSGGPCWVWNYRERGAGSCAGVRFCVLQVQVSTQIYPGSWTMVLRKIGFSRKPMDLLFIFKKL